MPLFYRIVRTNPPVVEDFLSQEAQGRPRPNHLEHLELYDGISVYDSEVGARRKARQYWAKTQALPGKARHSGG